MFKVKWTNCSHNDYKLYIETSKTLLQINVSCFKY